MLPDGASLLPDVPLFFINTICLPNPTRFCKQVKPSLLRSMGPHNSTSNTQRRIKYSSMTEMELQFIRLNGHTHSKAFL